MQEKIKKTWDELIEKIIFGYKKWWKQDTKERMQKLLLAVLKRKYEYNKTLLRQDRKMLKTINTQETIKTLRKPKVLIFEDDPFIRDIYTKKLYKSGFEVKSYDNYDKPFVVDVVAEEKPDLIYCDIIMPGIIGWEAIELLKKDKQTKDIPIVIVDNMCRKKEIQKGFDAGASEFLCKAKYTPTQVVEFFKYYLIKTGKFTKKDFH